MPLPRLVGFRTYVSDLAGSRDFWRRHFGLQGATQGDALRYEVGNIVWEQRPGGVFCGTRGPHGALPTFGVDDFGVARGHLLGRNVPIVFEEMLPGRSLLIFIDPDSNPFQLAQETSPAAWDISQRKALRTKRRHDAPRAEPISLTGVIELTLYAHDITASVRFYRDVIGLPVGLAYFAHVHLVAENLPVVLRTTRWQCKTPAQPHGSEPVFAGVDVRALAVRLRQAGHAPELNQRGLTVRDPEGIRLHFRGDD